MCLCDVYVCVLERGLYSFHPLTQPVELSGSLRLHWSIEKHVSDLFSSVSLSLPSQKLLGSRSNKLL